MGRYVSRKSPLYGDVSNQVFGAGYASESPVQVPRGWVQDSDEDPLCQFSVVYLRVMVGHNETDHYFVKTEYACCTGVRRG
ncbi:hypothetical protein SUGI_0866010 [Cryptomeria japonica]|nr:hypothetical protein SUGI_0866010 [Cryptomeria japonica]